MNPKDLLLNQINQKSWHFYVSRKMNWFIQNTQILANTPQALIKYIGFDVSQENYMTLDGDEYYTGEETKKFNRVLENESNKDSRFFARFAKKEFEIVKNIENFKARPKRENFAQKTNKQLSGWLDSFQEIYTEAFAPAFSRPDDYLEEKAKRVLSKGVFPLIATYPQLGELAYADEPLALLQIARESQKTGAVPQVKLDRHMEKYSWLKGPIFAENLSFTKEEYMQRIRNLWTKDTDEEIDRIKTVRKQDENNYQKTVKNYHLSGASLALAQAVRNFIFLRTYTTEASDSLFYLVRQTLLSEVAKRLGLTQQEIVMLSSDEMIQVLNKKDSKWRELAGERLKGYAIIWLNGDVATIFGKEAKTLQAEIARRFKGNQPNKIGPANIIKGSPASVGKVRGIAKILLSHNDVKKVNRGDIIVATMTTPDYVIAMEKAAAFVTDEGGITCHAAIVAREFGVPCIVGTGNATVLIRDGDVLEVDSTKGEVKILK